MVEFLSSVAMMENFSVKTRGKNKGTCAITRADVDLEELGGKDFFELVRLEEIVLGKKSKNATKCTLKDIIKFLKKVA